MGLHDIATVAGVTEACRYNSHEECRAPNCACSCHKPTPNPSIPQVAEAGPEKACPKCGTKRPFLETYCRIDGERLASLLCGVCGAGMNPEDNFCYSCGGPKGAVGQTKVHQVVTVPEVEVPVAGYEAQVLRGLQEELGNVQQPMDNQTVVETPAGPGTSFKLVSAPNPNKLRTPVPSGDSPRAPRPASKPAIRLPVKPS